MCVLELMNGHVLQTLREQSKVPGSRLGTCHYLAGGGGEGHYLGGRVIIFSLLSGGGSQFFSRFFRGGS